MLDSFSENLCLLSSNQDFKASTDELSTDVHENKKLESSNFFIEEENTFDCSFDQGTQKARAQLIWNASVAYTQSVLVKSPYRSKGLNDQSLFDFGPENLIESGGSFDQIIARNEILTTEQKYAFISMLQNEQELMDLFQELSSMFRESVFREIAYLVFKISEKRNQLLNHSQKNTQLSKFVLPHFDCFSNLQNWQPLQKIPYSPYKERKTHEEVKRQAELCFGSIADEIYYDKRLPLISFRDCKKECKNDNQVRFQFLGFFQTLTIEVYLSLEGFFCQFQGEQHMFLDSDSENESESELDFRSACSLEKFMSEEIRFVRGPRQFEKEELDPETNEGGRKRTKLE